MQVDIQDEVIGVTKGGKIIRIAWKHRVYVRDVVTQFDYYYDAVKNVNGVVDYSSPRFHWAKGFDLFPVMFPSFAEPVSTAKQYTDFAQLKEGMIVLDLGAYSGLTSIIFAELVGDSGRVVAVDADFQNHASIRSNIAEYFRRGKGNIKFIPGAVWSHRDGIYFSSEQNMGAAAVDIVGNRGEVRLVQSYTLSDIARGLDRVDFVKMDIEGAEGEAVKDEEFFKTHNPRLIIETHGRGIDAEVSQTLASYGYTVNHVMQDGCRFPLLECERKVDK